MSYDWSYLEPSLEQYKSGTQSTPEEEQVDGGLTASLKSTYGAGVKGLGQLAADYIPGVTTDNPLYQYGQEIIEENPTRVHSLSDLASNPFTGLAEIVGNVAPTMGAMVGSKVVGSALTAAAPLAGPAAPIVAGVGQVISWLGPYASAMLPSYSSIRDKQIFNDPLAQDSAKEKIKAVIGASTVAVIENKFGPQDWVGSLVTKEGRNILANKFASTSVGGRILEAGAKGGAIESLEELVQSPIEQFMSNDDFLSKESLADTGFGAVSGLIGGGVMGGGIGLLSKQNKPKPEPKPTQEPKPWQETLEDIRKTKDVILNKPEWILEKEGIDTSQDVKDPMTGDIFKGLFENKPVSIQTDPITGIPARDIPVADTTGNIPIWRKREASDNLNAQMDSQVQQYQENQLTPPGMPPPSSPIPSVSQPEALVRDISQDTSTERPLWDTPEARRRIAAANEIDKYFPPGRYGQIQGALFAPDGEVIDVSGKSVQEAVSTAIGKKVEAVNIAKRKVQKTTNLKEKATARKALTAAQQDLSTTKKEATVLAEQTGATVDLTKTPTLAKEVTKRLSKEAKEIVNNPMLSEETKKTLLASEEKAGLTETQKKQVEEQKKIAASLEKKTQGKRTPKGWTTESSIVEGKETVIYKNEDARIVKRTDKSHVLAVKDAKGKITNYGSFTTVKDAADAYVSKQTADEFYKKAEKKEAKEKESTSLNVDQLKLVASINIDKVAGIAQRATGTLDNNEAYDAAVVGIQKAAKKYTPGSKATFETYATGNAKFAIRDYQKKSGKTVSLDASSKASEGSERDSKVSQVTKEQIEDAVPLNIQKVEKKEEVPEATKLSVSDYLKIKEAEKKHKESKVSTESEEEIINIPLAKQIQKNKKIPSDANLPVDSAGNIIRSEIPSGATVSEVTLKNGKKIQEITSYEGDLYHGTPGLWEGLWKESKSIFFTENKEQARTYGENVKKKRISLKRPFVVDFQKSEYWQGPKGLGKAIAIAERIKSGGYFDGVLFLNIVDPGPRSNQVYKREPSTQVAIFSNKSIIEGELDERTKGKQEGQGEEKEGLLETQKEKRLPKKDLDSLSETIKTFLPHYKKGFEEKIGKKLSDSEVSSLMIEMLQQGRERGEMWLIGDSKPSQPQWAIDNAWNTINNKEDISPSLQKDLDQIAPEIEYQGSSKLLGKDIHQFKTSEGRNFSTLTLDPKEIQEKYNKIQEGYKKEGSIINDNNIGSIRDLIERSLSIKKSGTKKNSTDPFVHSPKLKAELESENMRGYDNLIFVEPVSERAFTKDRPNLGMNYSDSLETIELPENYTSVRLSDLERSASDRNWENNADTFRYREELAELAFEMGVDVIDGGSQWRVVNPKIKRISKEKSSPSLDKQYEKPEERRALKREFFKRATTADKLIKFAELSIGAVKDSNVSKAILELSKYIQKHATSKLGSVAVRQTSEYTKGSPSEVPGAFYYKGAIYLNHNYLSGLTDKAVSEIVTHEVTHAITEKEMEANPEIKKKVTDLMETLRKEILTTEEYSLLKNKYNFDPVRITKDRAAFEKDLGRLSAEVYYGLLNEKEFLAQAFSSKQFQEELNRINLQKPKGTIRTLWDKFVSTVRDALGMTTQEQYTALDEALSLGTYLFKTDVSSGRMGSIGARRYAISPSLDKKKKSTKTWDQREAEISKSTSLSERLKDRLGSFKDLTKEIVQVSSDVLRNIDDRILKPMREFEMKIAESNVSARKQIKEFYDGYKKIPDYDRNLLGLTLYNTDKEAIDKRTEILKKNNLEDSYKKVEQLLKDIHNAKEELGINDFDEIEGWFPRRVKDVDGLMKAVKEDPEYNILQAELDDLAKNKTSQEDKEHLIRSIINTGRYPAIAFRKGTSDKQRRIFKISSEWMKFYANPMDSLLSHIYESNEQLAAHSMFSDNKLRYKKVSRKRLLWSQLKDDDKLIGKGKDPKLSPKQREEKVSEIELIESDLNNQEKSFDRLDTLLVELAPDLDGKDAKAAINVIRARLTQRGMSGPVATIRNISLASAMGSPTSAITQITDLALSTWVNGIKNTIGAVFGPRLITAKDLDLEHSMKEFQTEGTAKWLDKVLTFSGMKYMDLFGKEVFIQSAINRAKEMSLEDFSKKWKHYLGNDTEQTYQELQDNKNSELTRFFAFNALSDWQPISLLEMPMKYQNAGNYRIFYALKSYNIKQLNNIYRESVISWRKSGTKEEKQRIARRTGSLIMFLAIAGASADELKDFLLGKSAKSFTDNFHENLLKIAFMSRYTLDQGFQKGFFETMLKDILLPPTGIVDDPFKDIISWFGDKPDFKTIRNLPWGKLPYEWFSPVAEASDYKRLKTKITNGVVKSNNNVSNYRKEIRDYNDWATRNKEKPITYSTLMQSKRRYLKDQRG